ncbi:MAG: hypothetical protein WC374_11210 [Phycisphaerae bacterium]|jgi:hypothetical protein
MANPIIFSKNSQLLPFIRQKVDKLRKTIISDKLTPWRWFNSRGIEITNFYGKTICQKGTVYGESTVSVIFHFIVPFLEDAIVKTLYETLEICRVRGLEPEEPYIRESAMVLSGHLLHPIYDEIVDIDRHLRGKGDPKSVGRRDVTDEITQMDNFLYKTQDEMVRGIEESGMLKTQQPIDKAVDETKTTPETDAKLIYQAEASQLYNIPKSTLSKAAKKSPGEVGYLWSGHKGKRIFYRKKDVEKLARSRAKLG